MPAALGEFKDVPLLVNRICKGCNERRIGVLDEQFVRCGPVAVLRKKFGIHGRQHHDTVNSFYRGSAGGHPVRFLAWDDSFQCEVLIELIEGNEGRQLSQMILKGQSGPRHHIPLTASTTADILRKKIADLHLTSPIELRLIYDPPTEPWAEELFKALWPDRELPQPTAGATGFKGGIIEFKTTNRYFRAIAKIGFHYFLTQFPEYSGHEAIFDDIRDFIITDTQGLEPNRVNNSLAFTGVPSLPNLLALSGTWYVPKLGMASAPHILRPL